MLQITENEILEAYNSFELSESELIELYSEGYISENTMDQLIEMGIFDEFLVEEEELSEEELEEGKITRGIREVGHQIKHQAKAIQAGVNAGRIVLNAAEALKSKNPKRSVKALQKMQKLMNKHEELKKSIIKDKIRHNIAQHLDAKNSGEYKVAADYKNKAKELMSKKMASEKAPETRGIL